MTPARTGLTDRVSHATKPPAPPDNRICCWACLTPPVACYVQRSPGFHFRCDVYYRKVIRMTGK